MSYAVSINHFLILYSLLFFLSFISVAMFHAGFRNRCLVDENFLLRNFKMKNYDFHVKENY